MSTFTWNESMFHVCCGCSSKGALLALVEHLMGQPCISVSSSKKSFWLKVVKKVIQHGLAHPDRIRCCHRRAVEAIVLSL